MELALLIYAINSLNKLTQLFVWGPLAFFIVCGVWTGMVYDEEQVDEKDKLLAWKWFNRSMLTLAICIPIAVLLPSTKTAWMMTGGYIAQSVVTSETADKLTKLVGVKLDEMIEEAISSKEKK